MLLDRLKELSGRGYFPNVLPTTFTTRDFGTHVREVLKDWSSNGTLQPDYRSASKLGKIADTEPEIVSVPKGNRERRLLQLVNPVSQAVLNDLISRNWNTISTWVGRSKFTYGTLEIGATGARAIPDPEFGLHRAHKEGILSVCNWITETDITRFYPSIYTHSIAWAAHGKDTYKKNPKKFKNGLADQLDIAVRKCNRNQTIGIPIGPDSSRVIAEIISAYVDTNVALQTGLTRAQADRLQDDWLIGSKTLEEAEARLSAVIKAYQELGLDINGRKTGITHVAEARFPKWRGRLLNLKSGRWLHGEALGEYLRTAINEQIENPGEAVLPYVYAVLIGARFNWDDLPLVQSFVTRSVAVDPRVMSSACILLLNLLHEGYKLDVDRIRERFVPLLEASLEVDHAFESIWALHLFRGLRVDLSKTRVAELADVGDGSAAKLVMLDLEANGLLSGLPKKAWLKQISVSQMLDPTWLLAYEGVRHGWLPDPGGVIRAHPMFAPMYARDIQFYDPRKNVPKRSNLRRLRLSRIQATQKATIRGWFGSYGA